jgi:glutathione peroxidase
MKIFNAKTVFLALFLLFSITIISKSKEDKKVESKTTSNVYNFKVKKLMGQETTLNEYKGKVLLIVNVASQCGLTPQYTGLQDLYKKFNAKGFEILGFPCNQFGSQEPGSSKEISEFCSTKFSVTFPMFEKIDVNGDNADPLYKYLKSNAPGTITDDIKWNFTKFLIDKHGKVINRYAPTTTPDKIEKDIESALQFN